MPCSKRVRPCGPARYDKTNYLFVYDTSGTVLVHGNRPEYEGSNRMHRVDSSGVKLVEEFTNVVKQRNAGFVEYNWKSNNFFSETTKITYVARIGKTEHFVGSGLAVEDIDLTLLREAAEASAKMLPFLILFLLGALNLGRKTAKALRD